MVTQVPRRLKLRDAGIDRLLRETWPLLPKNLQKSSKNLASIRFGAACYLALMIIFVGNSAQTSDPHGFMVDVFSMNSLVAVIGFIAAVIILFARSMQVAPRYVEAYVEMLPDYADEIQTIYAERGLADVAAPWITSRNKLGKMLKNLSKRFRLVP